MFEMDITDAFSLSTRGTVLSSRVRRGTVRSGDRAVLKSPGGEMDTRVAGVEVFRKILDVADEGDQAAILCRNITSNDLDRHTVLDGEVRRFENVVLVSAPSKWWEFWRD
jgi:elongation factor Tu